MIAGHEIDAFIGLVFFLGMLIGMLGERIRRALHRRQMLAPFLDEHLDG